MVMTSDDSDARYSTVVGETTFVKTGGSVEYTVTGDSSSYYVRATLVNSAGTSSGSVSGAGYLASDAVTGLYTKTLTVTAPSAAGSYTLNVTVNATYSTTSDVIASYSLPLKVVEPVVLKATLASNSQSSVTLDIYFFVNGQRIDDSHQSVTVSSTGTEVKYDYIVENLSGNYSFYVGSDDVSLSSGTVSGLGPDHSHSFYTYQTSYTWAEAIAVVAILLLLVLLVYVYRKPVKNYGKPKSRRQ